MHNCGFLETHWMSLYVLCPSPRSSTRVRSFSNGANVSFSVAEKTFLELRRIANKYPGIHCVAISHASKDATDKWVNAIGGAWAVKVIVDEEREVYAAWGLGVSTAYHLLNPWTQIAARKLGTNEQIWAREVVSPARRLYCFGAKL